jgi:hypothetical protein
LSTNDETDVAQRMEQAIRRYYTACNTGDVEAVAAFFTPGRCPLRPARLRRFAAGRASDR